MKRYVGAMPDDYYKVLTPEEDKEHRAWARDPANFTPLGNVEPGWHPVVRDECVNIDAEKLASLPISTQIALAVYAMVHDGFEAEGIKIPDPEDVRMEVMVFKRKAAESVPEDVQGTDA